MIVLGIYWVASGAPCHSKLSVNHVTIIKSPWDRSIFNLHFWLGKLRHREVIPNHTTNKLGRQNLALESGILNIILYLFSNTMLQSLSRYVVDGLEFMYIHLLLLLYFGYNTLRNIKNYFSRIENCSFLCICIAAFMVQRAWGKRETYRHVGWSVGPIQSWWEIFQKKGEQTAAGWFGLTCASSPFLLISPDNETWVYLIRRERTEAHYQGRNW